MNHKHYEYPLFTLIFCIQEKKKKTFHFYCTIILQGKKGIFHANTIS